MERRIRVSLGIDEGDMNGERLMARWRAIEKLGVWGLRVRNVHHLSKYICIDCFRERKRRAKVFQSVGVNAG